MKLKLKLVALAAMLATSASSFAAIDGAASGNGELIANFRFYNGNNDTDGNDISAVFDLGVGMNAALGWNGVAGFTRTWNLSTGAVTGSGIAGSQAVGNYGPAWNTLLNFPGINSANIEFNVIALDNSDATVVAGGSRYLTTADVATYPSLTNSSLSGFQDMNQYITANNTLGTHGTHANGASTALSGGSPNSYFGSINGSGDGDSWVTKTTADTTRNLATAQNFWFLTTSSTVALNQATKTPFGVDLNRNGAIGTGEFGEWSVNLAAGTITFANPVPEAETWAMLVAGLGLMGLMVRRRGRKPD